MKKRLKIAIMHYHLRPGGVTTVIKDQASTLESQADVLVLAGEESAENARTIPGLGYGRAGVSGPDAHETARAVLQAMRNEWGALADVLHVHNPTLNKNPSLPDVLRLLQDQGIRLFLQIHDFAEDGRPSAYYPRGEYPRDCHYGVINSRDKEALLSAGCDPRGVHLMWNVVRPLRSSANPRAGRLVYPVRAIRRKNIGEALLLGMFLDCGVTCTLPPRDKADAARYSRWKQLARDLRLDVVFDAGLERPLEEIIRDCRGAVTTSVNEGFGFAFLEPWTAGLPVGGRRIEHVCRDFEEEGIRLPFLYDSLPVPFGFFDASSFAERWRNAIAGSFSGFGRHLSESELASAWQTMSAAGVVDFASLDEQAQAETITRLRSRPRDWDRLEGPGLENLRRGLREPDASIIEANAAAIRGSYGPERYAQLLRRIYAEVMEVPISQRIDRSALLEYFLKPERFKPIAQREAPPGRG